MRRVTVSLDGDLEDAAMRFQRDQAVPPTLNAMAQVALRVPGELWVSTVGQEVLRCPSGAGEWFHGYQHQPRPDRYSDGG